MTEIQTFQMFALDQRSLKRYHGIFVCILNHVIYNIAVQKYTTLHVRKLLLHVADEISN